MKEQRTGINYEFSWNPIPGAFLSQRYYDHMVQSELFEAEGQAILDFPTIDSNAMITHWGVSFFLIGVLNSHIEEFIQCFDGIYINLIINGGRVFGYSGLRFIPSAWITLGGVVNPNTSFNIGVIRNLAPLSFPITQDGSTVRIIFEQNFTQDTWRVYGRVRGVYAISD